MAGIRYFLTAVLSALYWNDSLSVHSKSRRTFYKRCRLYYSSTTFLCYWHVDAPAHIKRTSKRNLSDYRHRYFHRGKKQTGKRLFFPEYEFQKDGQLYHITSQTDYSVCYVTQGKQIDLCYAPDAPTTFYVPLMQRHDNRLAGLLCGVGILWPLFGLFAPLIRTIFSFLYETP